MDETAVRSACARHYKIAKCRTPQETKNSPGSPSGVNIKRAAADWCQSQGGNTRQQNECECPHSASAPSFPERPNDHTPQMPRKSTSRASVLNTPMMP